MLWDKIRQQIQSQATKLNIPVEIIQQPINQIPSSQQDVIRVIFIQSSSEPVKVEESALLIGLSPTKEDLKAINQIIQDNLPILAETYHQNQKDQFKNLVLSGIETRKTSLKDSIQQNEYTLESLSREIFETSRKRDLDKHLLVLLEKPVTPMNRKINSEYSSLKKLVPSLYQAIYIDSPYIRAKTYPVSISYEGDDYDIGTLLIELDLSKGEAKITNLTNTPNGYHHPHVNDTGEICLGNISTGLARMLGEFEIFGALELLHKFIHTYNEPDAYQKIQYWNDPDYAEEDDEYERCRESGSYGRTCLDCGDTTCPYYEGALEECMENADFPKCVGCKERCSAGEELLKDCQNENPLGCLTCTFSNCLHFRDSDTCHSTNLKSCKSCNIDYCKFRGVQHETIAA